MVPPVISPPTRRSLRTPRLLPPLPIELRAKRAASSKVSAREPLHHGLAKRSDCGDSLCYHRFSRAPEVYSAPELVSMILQQSDFPTVVTISRLDRTGRELAQKEIQSRIRNVVDPFIEPNHFPFFVQMLGAMGAGIVGSVARRLLARKSKFMDEAYTDGDEGRYDASANLNVVIRNGEMDTAKDCFSALGYGEWDDERLYPAYASVVCAIVVGTKRWANKDGERKFTVTLSESKGGLMQVVLASPFTAQANLITATGVYSAYPNLATANYTLRTDNTYIRYARQLRSCYDIVRSNSLWERPCGDYCPAALRKTPTDKVVASILWNPAFERPQSRYPHVDFLVAESRLVWRFTNKCRNVKCKNFTANPRLVRVRG